MWEKVLPWSDNWWIEGNQAFFCTGEFRALFRVDMMSQQCELVSRIPENNFYSFRLNSYCIKRGNNIFCLPAIGKCIWYYDLGENTWEKIEVGNEYQMLISISTYQQDHGRIWLLEEEGGKIFEVDLECKNVENIYNIPQCDGELLGRCVWANNRLYGVCGKTVYCIDNAAVDIYEVLGVKAELHTICYDGVNFWLSGYYKEIYIWNPDQGIVKVITNFPDQFGLYYFRRDNKDLLDYHSFFSGEIPFFYDSLSLGQYIWYIPAQANEIFYIDKESYEINVLEIEEEQETRESLMRLGSMNHKYLVEYIRGNRYIGLYSLKNRLVFEIDTVELCVKNKNYVLSDETIVKIGDEYYKERGLLQEKSKADRMFYSALLVSDDEEKKDMFHSIGKHIYHTIDF